MARRAVASERDRRRPNAVGGPGLSGAGRGGALAVRTIRWSRRSARQPGQHPCRGRAGPDVGPGDRRPDPCRPCASTRSHGAGGGRSTSLSGSEPGAGARRDRTASTGGAGRTGAPAPHPTAARCGGAASGSQAAAWRPQGRTTRRLVLASFRRRGEVCQEDHEGGGQLLDLGAGQPVGLGHAH